jgi:hypothetical protein
MFARHDEHKAQRVPIFLSNLNITKSLLFPGLSDRYQLNRGLDDVMNSASRVTVKRSLVSVGLCANEWLGSRYYPGGDLLGEGWAGGM